MIDWIALGTETMRSARKAKGLSYEAMGRLLNVAAKTYERWEKRGEVPPYRLDDVARVLELEIDRPARVRVTSVVAGTSESNGDDPAVAMLERVLTELGQLQAGQDAIGDRIARLESERSARVRPEEDDG